jgi:hypothetical protein
VSEEVITGSIKRRDEMITYNKRKVSIIGRRTYVGGQSNRREEFLRKEGSDDRTGVWSSRRRVVM